MDSYTLKVEKSGRILIPAPVRQRMNITEGSDVILRVGETGIQLETRENAIERIQRELRKYIPEGRSLSEELLAERREEAARDNARLKTIAKSK